MELTQGNQYQLEDPMCRIMDKVDIGDNLCWLFPYTDKRGYAMVWFGRRPEKGHRFMYRVYKGEIPEGLQIDHLCMVKNCINPDHLEAVTLAENMARLFSSMTGCRRGHKYAEGNYRLVKYKNDTTTSRLCLPCQKIRDNKKIKRRRDARINQLHQVV